MRSLVLLAVGLLGHQKIALSQNVTASCMASAVGGNALQQFNSIDPKDNVAVMMAFVKGLNVALAGKGADGVYLMMLPAKISELFTNGKFDAAKGEAMGSRLEQVTPEMVQTAKAALSRLDSQADDVAAAVMLARHEPSFKGSALIPARANQFSERLSKTPDSSRAQWSTTTGLDTALAAASLARCDGLFRADGSFNQANFASVLPAAEALVKERRK